MVKGVCHCGTREISYGCTAPCTHSGCSATADGAVGYVVPSLVAVIGGLGGSMDDCPSVMAMTADAAACAVHYVAVAGYGVHCVQLPGHLETR